MRWTDGLSPEENAKHCKSIFSVLSMGRKGAGSTSHQEREMKMGRTATMLNLAKAVPNHHALSVHKPLRGYSWQCSTQIPWIFPLVRHAPPQPLYSSLLTVYIWGSLQRTDFVLPELYCHNIRKESQRFRGVYILPLWPMGSD